MISADEAAFIGFIFEGISWGVYLVIFTLSLTFLIWRRTTKRINWRMVFATVLLFTLCTTHYILEIENTITIYFNNPDGIPLADETPVLFGADTIFSITDFFANLVLIYRLWLVWSKNWYIIILPLLIACASISCSMASVGLLATLDPTAPLAPPENSATRRRGILDVAYSQYPRHGSYPRAYVAHFSHTARGTRVTAGWSSTSIQRHGRGHRVWIAISRRADRICDAVRLKPSCAGRGGAHRSANIRNRSYDDYRSRWNGRLFGADVTPHLLHPSPLLAHIPQTARYDRLRYNRPYRGPRRRLRDAIAIQDSKFRAVLRWLRIPRPAWTCLSSYQK